MVDDKKPIVKTTEDCLNLMEDGLAHYTMSESLKDILLDDALCLMASCFSKYWKEEETIHDDAQEFRGALSKIRWENIKLLSPSDRKDFEQTKKHPKFVPDNQEYKSGPQNGLCIQSTSTPYFVCFSYEKNISELYHRFCNPKKGVPVMIHLNASLFLEKGAQVNDRLENPLDKQIVLDVSYYKEPSDLRNKNLIEEKGREIKTLVTPFSNSKEKHQSEMTNKRGNYEGDNLIDACLLLKKKEYDNEKEIRYLCFTDEQYDFKILENGKFDFTFSGVESGSGKDKKVLLNFPPECVESIQFGSCVEYYRAKRIANELIFSRKAFQKLPVYLYDDTKILPDTKNE